MHPYGSPVRQDVVDGKLCNVYRDVYSSQPDFSFFVDVSHPITTVNAMEPAREDEAALEGMSANELVSNQTSKESTQQHNSLWHSLAEAYACFFCRRWMCRT
jgi:hypothetical protein